MQFEYMYVTTSMGSIDIEDLGNFALWGINDLYQEFIIIVQTSLGNTKILEYGPIMLESRLPCKKMKYTYDELEFKESKIAQRVEKFLGDKNMISQVLLIDVEEAKSKMVDLKEFLII